MERRTSKFEDLLWHVEGARRLEAKFELFTVDIVRPDKKKHHIVAVSIKGVMISHHYMPVADIEKLYGGFWQRFITITNHMTPAEAQARKKEEKRKLKVVKEEEND